jgi:hypothetical protein
MVDELSVVIFDQISKDTKRAVGVFQSRKEEEFRREELVRGRVRAKAHVRRVQGARFVVSEFVR